MVPNKPNLPQVDKEITNQIATTQPTASTHPAPPLTILPSSAQNIQLGGILIVTVTKVEAQAVLHVFSQAAGITPTREFIGDKTYYNLGTHGGVPVFMVRSEPGIATLSGALLTTHQAIQDLAPQAVIICGIAFGLHPSKQHLGDILVAKQIQYYEPRKVDMQQGQIPRGDRATSAVRLLDRFRNGELEWQDSSTHFGLVLSGEALINDPAFRDELLEIAPEAIGGEMEGAGLYAAAHSAKVDWILVKAICDWADGEKNDDAHPLAARNAAQFVFYVLQLGGWDRVEQLRSKDVFDYGHTTYEIRIERKVDQLVTEQEQIPQQLALQHEELKSLLLQTFSLEDPQSENLLQEKVYDAQIDQARDLIREDKASAALSLLKKLEVELQNCDVSAELRFRLLTNLGASFLPLGQDVQAVPYFERALDYAPNNPKALSNVALAALIQEDFERAIKLAEQALEIQSDYPSALSVWIQALAKTHKFDQLDQDQKSVIERNVESRRALAFILLEAKDYEQAEKLLRFSVESGESEPQDLALLAQAILAPTQITWREAPPLPWNISTDEIARLEEAETLLTEVIDAWNLIENRRRFHSALMPRVYAREMQGKLELAKADCQRILYENPTHPLALGHSGILALQTDNFGEAIEYFEQCMDNPVYREQTRILLAAAYLRNEQPRDTLEILLQGKDDEREQTISVHIKELSLIAQAAQKVEDTAQVADVAERLYALPDDNPLVLDAMASIDWLQGNADNAIKHLQQALELADGYFKDYLALRLADIYYSQRQFDKAIPLYEIIAPTDGDSSSTRDYAVSLLNSGNLAYAYDFAREIRNGGDAIPVISEVEAKIAEYIGDLEPALHLYTQLSKLEPNNPEHFLGVASVYIRLGKPEEAASFFDPVVERFWDDPHTLINIARVFANVDRPASDVLPLAYRARRLRMDEPEIHLSYLHLLGGSKTRSDSLLDLDPSEVGVDTSVQLTSEREIKWYTILDEEPVDRGRWEILESDPAAQKLLGHQVGKTIQLKEGPYEQLAYKITKIQSKYERASQDTIRNFGTWFPDHSGLHLFKIVGNDIPPISQVTEMPRRWRDEMRKLYDSRQVTLERFAQSIGGNIATAWSSNMTAGEQTIASEGTRQKQEFHRRILESSTNITIDPLALFTLTRLKQPDVVARRFQQVYVAQASIDVLIEEIQRLRQFDQEYDSIGREGERYTFTAVLKQVTVHNIQFVEQVLAFVRENCQIVPVSRALELGPKRFEQAEFALGRSSIASVLVAAETNTLLYSDDFLLRIIAQRDFSVAGVWTQPVLSSARDQGILKEEEYYDSIATLISVNYYYVPVDTSILMHVLKKHQWVAGPAVAEIFALLDAKTTTLDAINVVVNLIERVWAERIPLYQKIHILDLCLRALVTGRDREIVLHMLWIVLQERFPPLVEHRLQQIDNAMAEWLQVHQWPGI